MGVSENFFLGGEGGRMMRRGELITEACLAYANCITEMHNQV